MWRFAETKYGFEWGPLMVTRVCSAPKWGVAVEIETSRGHIVDVRVTPGGMLRVSKLKRKSKKQVTR